MFAGAGAYSYEFAADEYSGDDGRPRRHRISGPDCTSACKLGVDALNRCSSSRSAAEPDIDSEDRPIGEVVLAARDRLTTRGELESPEQGVAPVDGQVQG